MEVLGPAATAGYPLLPRVFSPRVITHDGKGYLVSRTDPDFDGTATPGWDKDHDGKGYLDSRTDPDFDGTATPGWTKDHDYGKGDLAPRTDPDCTATATPGLTKYHDDKGCLVSAERLFVTPREGGRTDPGFVPATSGWNIHHHGKVCHASAKLRDGKGCLTSRVRTNPGFDAATPDWNHHPHASCHLDSKCSSPDLLDLSKPTNNRGVAGGQKEVKEVNNNVPLPASKEDHVGDLCHKQKQQQQEANLTVDLFQPSDQPKIMDCSCRKRKFPREQEGGRQKKTREHQDALVSDVRSNATSNVRSNSDVRFDLDVCSNASPDVRSNSDVWSNACPDVRSNASPDDRPNASPNVRSNASPDVRSNASPDVRSNASPDIRCNASHDVRSNLDVRSNGSPDVQPNASSDVLFNASPKVQRSAIPDVSSQQAQTRQIPTARCSDPRGNSNRRPGSGEEKEKVTCAGTWIPPPACPQNPGQHTPLRHPSYPPLPTPSSLPPPLPPLAHAFSSPRLPPPPLIRVYSDCPSGTEEPSAMLSSPESSSRRVVWKNPGLAPSSHYPAEAVPVACCHRNQESCAPLRQPSQMPCEVQRRRQGPRHFRNATSQERNGGLKKHCVSCEPFAPMDGLASSPSSFAFQHQASDGLASDDLSGKSWRLTGNRECSLISSDPQSGRCCNGHRLSSENQVSCCCGIGISTPPHDSFSSEPSRHWRQWEEQHVQQRSSQWGEDKAHRTDPEVQIHDDALAKTKASDVTEPTRRMVAESGSRPELNYADLILVGKRSMDAEPCGKAVINCLDLTRVDKRSMDAEPCGKAVVNCLDLTRVGKRSMDVDSGCRTEINHVDFTPVGKRPADSGSGDRTERNHLDIAPVGKRSMDAESRTKAELNHVDFAEIGQRSSDALSCSKTELNYDDFTPDGQRPIDNEQCFCGAERGFRVSGGEHGVPPFASQAAGGSPSGGGSPSPLQGYHGTWTVIQAPDVASCPDICFVYAKENAADTYIDVARDNDENDQTDNFHRTIRGYRGGDEHLSTTTQGRSNSADKTVVEKRKIFDCEGSRVDMNSRSKYNTPSSADRTTGAFTDEQNDEPYDLSTKRSKTTSKTEEECPPFVPGAHDKLSPEEGKRCSHALTNCSAKTSCCHDGGVSVTGLMGGCEDCQPHSNAGGKERVCLDTNNRTPENRSGVSLISMSALKQPEIPIAHQHQCQGFSRTAAPSSYHHDRNLSEWSPPMLQTVGKTVMPWSSFDSHSGSRDWRDNGSPPHHGRDWRDNGSPPYHCRDWRDNGSPPYHCRDWRDNGSPPLHGRDWSDIGSPSHHGRDWSHNGSPPHSLATLQTRVKKVETPRRDNGSPYHRSSCGGGQNWRGNGSPHSGRDWRDNGSPHGVGDWPDNSSPHHRRITLQPPVKMVQSSRRDTDSPHHRISGSCDGRDWRDDGSSSPHHRITLQPRVHNDQSYETTRDHGLVSSFVQRAVALRSNDIPRAAENSPQVPSHSPQNLSAKHHPHLPENTGAKNLTFEYTKSGINDRGFAAEKTGSKKLALEYMNRCIDDGKFATAEAAIQQSCLKTTAPETTSAVAALSFYATQEPENEKYPLEFSAVTTQHVANGPIPPVSPCLTWLKRECRGVVSDHLTDAGRETKRESCRRETLRPADTGREYNLAETSPKTKRESQHLTDTRPEISGESCRRQPHHLTDTRPDSCGRQLHHITDKIPDSCRPQQNQDGQPVSGTGRAPYHQADTRYEPDHHPPAEPPVSPWSATPPGESCGGDNADRGTCNSARAPVTTADKRTKTLRQPDNPLPLGAEPSVSPWPRDWAGGDRSRGSHGTNAGFLHMQPVPVTVTVTVTANTDRRREPHHNQADTRVHEPDHHPAAAEPPVSLWPASSRGGERSAERGTCNNSAQHAPVTTASTADTRTETLRQPDNPLPLGAQPPVISLWPNTRGERYAEGVRDDSATFHVLPVPVTTKTETLRQPDNHLPLGAELEPLVNPWRTPRGERCGDSVRADSAAYHVRPVTVAVPVAVPVTLPVPVAVPVTVPVTTKPGRRRRARLRTFQCSLCPVACSNRGQLQGHLRTHTGERPFPCREPGCHKTFVRNEELTRHRRIHSGERPYACRACSKAFTRKDHLNKHLRMHLETPGL